MERTGWSGIEPPLLERIPKHFGNPDQPVCAAAVASHLFIDGAATPPYFRRGIASLKFIHSFYRPRVFR
jgi:hypothetical protein